MKILGLISKYLLGKIGSLTLSNFASIYFVFHVAVVFLFFCLLCKPYYVCVLSVCVKEGKINSVKPLSPLSSPSLERF